MDHREIAGRFNARFRRRADTVLVGGAEEPLYLPADHRRPAMIRYTRDYAQSALHELAHWCRACPARRRLVDYGLWYQPPPRSAADQARFYAVEVPVQALEMLLAAACGVIFHFSSDDPGQDEAPARAAFEAQVGAACRDLLTRGPGPLASEVLETLNPGWRGAAAAVLAARDAGGGS